MTPSSLIRHTRSIPRLLRGYQSLALNINYTHRPVIPYRISEEEEELHTSPDLPLPKQSTTKKVEGIQKFIHPLKLQTDALLSVVYPDRSSSININMNDTTQLMDTEALEKVGFTLLTSVRTKFMLDYASKVSDDAVGIVESELFRRFIKPSKLTHYIASTGFSKNLVLTGSKPTESTRKAFYTLLGLVSTQLGKDVAEKWVLERVIQGQEGLFQLALKK